MLTNILLGILAIGMAGAVAMLFLLLTKKQETGDTEASLRFKAELDQAKKELGKLERELEAVKEKNGELTGKNKELWAQNERLEAKSKAAERERDQLQRTIAKYEENEVHEREKADERLSRLAKAEASLVEERRRIIKEDEERLAREQAERDRIWNDHERTVVNLLTEICSREESKFDFYDNTSLPKGFDGSLKPDFLVEFLGQYIIFDAKTSKSNDLRTYLRDTIKKTAQKIKKKTDIYHTVFLVVPTEAVCSLKELTHYEQNITFHIVSPESLQPILATFKRMTEYEFADQFNPEDRENIVNAFASLSHHIKSRNAYDVILAHLGVKALEDIDALPEDLVKDIATKTEKTKTLIPTKTEVQKLTASNDSVKKVIGELVSPKEKVSKKLIRDAANAHDIPMELES